MTSLTNLRTQSALWIMILLCSVFFSLGAAERVETKMIRKTGEAVENLTITVEVSKASYTLEESVLLTVTLKNVGETEFRTRKSTPLGMFNLAVTLPNGKEAPLTLFGKKHALGSAFASGILALAPDEEYSTSLKLNRYFDMTLAGEYSISVNKKVSVVGGKTTVSAPALVISITDE